MSARTKSRCRSRQQVTIGAEVKTNRSQGRPALAAQALQRSVYRAFTLVEIDETANSTVRKRRARAYAKKPAARGKPDDPVTGLERSPPRGPGRFRAASVVLSHARFAGFLVDIVAEAPRDDAGQSQTFRGHPATQRPRGELDDEHGGVSRGRTAGEPFHFHQCPIINDLNAVRRCPIAA